jgi:hypothetical protein
MGDLYETRSALAILAIERDRYLPVTRVIL